MARSEKTNSGGSTTPLIPGFAGGEFPRIIKQLNDQSDYLKKLDKCRLKIQKITATFDDVRKEAGPDPDHLPPQTTDIGPKPIGKVLPKILAELKYQAAVLKAYDKYFKAVAKAMNACFLEGGK